MWRLSSLLLVGSWLLAFGFSSASAMHESAARTRVEEALECLDSWLGDGERAVGWRRYLRTADLRQQLESDLPPDRAVLQEILQRYESGESGLDRHRFVAVRRALENWLAELPPLSLGELPGAARRAKQHFSPLTDDDVQRAYQRLQQAATDVERLVRRWSAEDRERLFQAVDWEVFQEQLQKEPPDLRTLLSVSRNFYQDTPGLELPEWDRLRKSLARYLDTRRFAENPRAEEFYQRYLDEIAQRLETYAASPNVEDHVIIGQLVGWMERYQQVEDLVAAIRYHHSHPNFHLAISGPLLQAGIATELDEQMTVWEEILGTTIRANSHLQGEVTLDLVPDDERAVLDLILAGTVNSDNTGYNGPVRIFSDGTTRVGGRKRIAIDAEGIDSSPAVVSARTRTRIRWISARTPVVESIAWNRARRTQPQYEAIASGRSGRRVASRMDARIEELLATPQARFEEDFRKPLLRRDAFPRELAFRTSEDQLFVRLLQAADSQLGSPGAPPNAAEGYDLSLGVHQSLVGNLSQALLGGVSLSDQQLQEFLAQLLGEVPEAFRIAEEDEPWGITFAAERPFHVQFQDQGFTVALRATRFRRGDQTVRENIEVSATYSLERTADGAHLARQDEIDIRFVDRPKMRVGDVAVHTFLRQNFSELFQEQFATEGLELPGRWQDAGRLILETLDSSDGWLAIAWNHVPPEADEDEANGEDEETGPSEEPQAESDEDVVT